MKILVTILLLLNCFISNAQTISVYVNEKGEKITHLEYLGYGRRAELIKKEFRGSVWLIDSLQRGDVAWKDTHMVNVPILYNLLNDQILIKVDGKNQVYLKNVDFNLGNKKFISVKGHHYELLYEDTSAHSSAPTTKMKLLRRYSGIIKEREPMEFTSVDPYNGEIIRNESYFFLTENKELIEFKMDPKSIENALQKINPSLEKEIEAQISSIKNSDDLVTLLKIRFMNE